MDTACKSRYNRLILAWTTTAGLCFNPGQIGDPNDTPTEGFRRFVGGGAITHFQSLTRTMDADAAAMARTLEHGSELLLSQSDVAEGHSDIAETQPVHYRTIQVILDIVSSQFFKTSCKNEISSPQATTYWVSDLS